jgi:lipid II isoglutaminyl synthase (glutamine-hydrolysing)
VPRELRVCALYPDLMNIYADRGNLLLLERRCRWRGLGFSLSSASLGEPLDSDGADLYYIGGGQDRDQRLVAFDLAEHKRDALHAAADRGAVVLAVCGGYQLLGSSYQLGEEALPGVGLVDLWTVRAEDGGGKTPSRLIGNVAIEVTLEPDGAPRVLAGFENHGGRTHLGSSAEPLGRVLKGFGNNGHDGDEGVRRDNVIGTYLHGPLLPKNAWFADWLTQTALGLDEPLESLEDELERRAHADALRAAGVQR